MCAWACVCVCVWLSTVWLSGPVGPSGIWLPSCRPAGFFPCKPNHSPFIWGSQTTHTKTPTDTHYTHYTHTHTAWHLNLLHSKKKDRLPIPMTNSVFLHLQLLSFSSFKMHKQTTEDILEKFFFFFKKQSSQCQRLDRGGDSTEKCQFHCYDIDKAKERC